jgi:hypothetical protein
MQYPGRLFASVTAPVLLATAWQAWGEMLRPARVPDLLDPAVQARFVVLSVARLGGDPDFPALFLGNITGESPRFLLVILDARNGKETWSLREDAPIFFLLMADAETIQRAFLDEGFAANGIASGSFIASGPEAGEHLLARLRESHRRLRGLTSLRPAGLSLP